MHIYTAWHSTFRFWYRLHLHAPTCSSLIRKSRHTHSSSVVAFLLLCVCERVFYRTFIVIVYRQKNINIKFKSTTRALHCRRFMLGCQWCDNILASYTRASHSRYLHMSNNVNDIFFKTWNNIRLSLFAFFRWTPFRYYGSLSLYFPIEYIADTWFKQIFFCPWISGFIQCWTTPLLQTKE